MSSLFNRYLVAKRDFEEGELIFEETALAVGPNPESTLQCLICSKKVCYYALHFHLHTVKA